MTVNGKTDGMELADLLEAGAKMGTKKGVARIFSFIERVCYHCRFFLVCAPRAESEGCSKSSAIIYAYIRL